MTMSLILVINFAIYAYDLDLNSQATGRPDLLDHSSYHYEFTRALACGGGFDAYDSELIAVVSMACDIDNFSGDWEKGSPFVQIKGTDQHQIAELLSYHFPRRGSKDIYGRPYPGSSSCNCRIKNKKKPPALGQILSLPCNGQPELTALEKWALNGSKLEIYSFKNQKYLNVFYATCTQAVPGALMMFTCGLIALMYAHRKNKPCSLFCALLGFCSLIVGFVFFSITIFARNESPLIKINNSNWSYVVPHSLPAFGIYLHSLSDSYSHQSSICDQGYIGHHTSSPLASTYQWHWYHEWGYASVHKGVPYTLNSSYAMWDAIKMRNKHENRSPMWKDDKAIEFINAFVSLMDPRQRRKLAVEEFLMCVNYTVQIPPDPTNITYVQYNAPSFFNKYVFFPWVNSNGYILGGLYGVWALVIIFIIIWETRARRKQMEKDIAYHYSVHDTRRPKSLIAPHSASRLSSTGRNSRLVSKEACGDGDTTDVYKKMPSYGSDCYRS